MILVVDLIRNQRLLNVPVIISIISFHAYGVFQSMQYIPMIWMLIFLCLGYAMTLDEKVLPERVRRITGVVIKVVIMLVLIGGVVYFVGRGSQGLAEKYGLKAYAQDQDWHRYHGFYHKEKGPSGDFRWSGKRGVIRISGREQGAGSREGEKGRGLEGQGSEVGGGNAEGGGKDGMSGMGGGLVQLRIECHTPGVDKEPVTVDIRVDDEPVDRLVFHQVGAKEWWYWVNRGWGAPRLNTLKGDPVQRGRGSRELGAGGKGHEILIDVSRTWNPKRMGISGDVRDLGVAVGEPKVVKELPKEGVGFYKWETLDQESVERIADRAGSREHGAGSREHGAGSMGRVAEDRGQRSEDVGKDGMIRMDGGLDGKDGKGEKRFRWTGRRASVPASGQWSVASGQKIGDKNRDKCVVFLRCAHPDIEKDGVVVTILGDGVVLRHFEFGDYGWRKVVFEGEELEGKKIITYEVSRTWNPKGMGVSQDNRDLGVAVAIPCVQNGGRD